MGLPQKLNDVNSTSHQRMIKCKRLSIDDLSRHVPIYRNGNFSTIRPQFRKLHRKLKTHQRTFNRSKLQNCGIFVEIASNDAGIVRLTILQALMFISLQSGRNAVSQLTLTYSLIAVESFETIFFRVSSFCTNCFHSLIIAFQNANRKWFSFTLVWNKTCHKDVVW